MSAGALARVLVIGVDSGLGRAAADALTARGDDVVGTTRRAQSTGPGARLRLDLSDPDIEKASLPPVDVAVICAAMARFTDCREQPELARRVNVTAPTVLGRRLTEAGTRVILLSTSAVFDGRTPHAQPDRPRTPRSAYGRLKAEAEAAILALGHKASILRLTKVLTPDMALVRGWLDALGRGQRIEAFADLTIAPLALEDVVQGLLGAIDDLGGGVYQLSGRNDISYFQFANHLATRLRVSPELVQTARAIDHIPANELMRYTTLNTDRINKLTGWVAPGPFEVIDRVFGPDLADQLAAR